MHRSTVGTVALDRPLASNNQKTDDRGRSALSPDRSTRYFSMLPDTHEQYQFDNSGK